MRKHRQTDQFLGEASALNTTLLFLRYLLWALLVLTGLAIASLNADSVMLNYFWNTVSLPLSLLLFCSFTAGWLIGIGLNLVTYIRLNAQYRRLKQRFLTSEEEVVRLKKDFLPHHSD